MSAAPRIVAETARLRLRSWTRSEGDVAAALRLYGDERVLGHVGDGRPLDEAAVRRSLEAAALHLAEHGCQHWAVEERSSGEVVGACGFHALGPGPRLEMVFHVVPTWWGRGVATEAARAALEDAVRRLAPASIHAWHHPDNPAPGRILERLGFRAAGTERFEDSGVEEVAWVWSPAG